jgi:hypothetical protein
MAAVGSQWFKTPRVVQGVSAQAVDLPAASGHLLALSAQSTGHHLRSTKPNLVL